MTNLENIISRLKAFNQDRNWPLWPPYKDLALSAAIELGELLEHFQWKSEIEIKQYLEQNRLAVAEELADVMIYLLQLSDKLEINVLEAIDSKINKNAQKYPAIKIEAPTSLQTK